MIRIALPLLACSISAQIVVSPSGPVRTASAARDDARAERRTGQTGPITIAFRAVS